VWFIVVQIFARFSFNKPSSVGLLTIFFLINKFSSFLANIKKKKIFTGCLSGAVSGARVLVRGCGGNGKRKSRKFHLKKLREGQPRPAAWWS
jgi:hypothetical protein